VAGLSAPFDLDGQEVVVSASVGIGIYPLDGDDADTLLRNADTAMYQAKAMGRRTFMRYAGSMEADVRRRASLSAAR